MRIVGTTVAVLATAVMLSSLASPSLAAGKKDSKENSFGNSLVSLFDSFGDRGRNNNDNDPKRGGDSERGRGGNHGGGHGGGHGNGHGNGHGGWFQRLFTDNPGTPGTPAVSGTNTIVYFGTCLNPAGFQQAGNAAADGSCLPFESLVGNEGSPGTAGTDPTCTITSSKPSSGEMGRGRGNGNDAPSSQTLPGSCSTYQNAGHDHDHEEPIDESSS